MGLKPMTITRLKTVCVCWSLVALVGWTPFHKSSCPDERSEGRRAVGDKTGAVIGVVKDEEGSALEDAKVEIRDKSKTVLTKSDGTYRFTGLEAEREYRLDMTKRMYADNGTSVTVAADVDNKASDVALRYKGVNVGSLSELVNLLDKKKYDEFEKRLRGLVSDCQGIGRQDCAQLREAEELYRRGDSAEVRRVLEKILGTKGQ
jgi:hypothetical protein